MLPTARRGGTLEVMLGRGGSSFLGPGTWACGGVGSCFVGGGAGAGAEKPEETGTGRGGAGFSSGVRASLDFVLWKENCDTEAAVPAFIAVRDGTRRPRGRFSESKMAIVGGGDSQWIEKAQTVWK